MLYFKGVFINITLLPNREQNLQQLGALYPWEYMHGEYKSWSKRRIRRVILETLRRKELQQSK